MPSPCEQTSKHVGFKKFSRTFLSTELRKISYLLFLMKFQSFIFYFEKIKPWETFMDKLKLYFSSSCFNLYSLQSVEYGNNESIYVD